MPSQQLLTTALLLLAVATNAYAVAPPRKAAFKKAEARQAPSGGFGGASPSGVFSSGGFGGAAPTGGFGGAASAGAIPSGGFGGAAPSGFQTVPRPDGRDEHGLPTAKYRLVAASAPPFPIAPRGTGAAPPFIGSGAPFSQPTGRFGGDPSGAPFPAPTGGAGFGSGSGSGNYRRQFGGSDAPFPSLVLSGSGGLAPFPMPTGVGGDPSGAPFGSGAPFPRPTGDFGSEGGSGFGDFFKQRDAAPRPEVPERNF